MALLAYNIVEARTRAAAAEPYIRPVFPGAGLSLPGVAYELSFGTMVFALTDPCYECLNVMPKYSDVAKKARASGVQVVVVSSDPHWIARLGMNPSEVRFVKASPYTLGIGLTPGIVWVTPDGVMQQEWIGSFTEIERKQIEARVERLAAAPLLFSGDISGRLVDRLLSETEFTIIDVRERPDFSAGSSRLHTVNIPLEEIYVRARHELSQESPILIDCAKTGPAICYLAKVTLEAEGFPSVGMIDRGKIPPAGCRIPKQASRSSAPQGTDVGIGTR
jgi:hypothetical protein